MNMTVDVDPLGLYENIWACMVCGDNRTFDEIAVVHRPIAGLEDYAPDSHANVAYCRDRPTCLSAAHRKQAWPPPAVVLQAGDTLRVSAAAFAERPWVTDKRLPSTAVGILTWLRDEPATIAQLMQSYTEPAEELFDTVRTLVQRGMVEVSR